MHTPPRGAAQRAGAGPLPELAGAGLLFLDHPDLDLGTDLGVQPDRDRIDAQRLDRLVQLDLAPVDLEVEALLRQPFRDIRGRDRAEQLRLRAGPRLERERDLLDLRRAASRLEVVPLGPGFRLLPLLLELPDRAR